MERYVAQDTVDRNPLIIRPMTMADKVFNTLEKLADPIVESFDHLSEQWPAFGDCWISGSCINLVIEAETMRIAPVKVPASGVIKSVRARIPKKTAKFIYDAKTGRHRNTSTGQFVEQSELPYKPNNGFANNTIGILKRGRIIDRYGNPSGKHASRPGTTISERGMPPGSGALPYQRYEVVKPIKNVEIGPIKQVPEFEAVGGGIQYYFKKSMEQLVKEGFLKKIP